MFKMKKLFNRLFFLIFIILNKKNTKLTKNFINEIDEIVIIGRGYSANYFFKKIEQYPKTIGLVNFTDKDLKDIDMNIFDNKDIFLFINLEAPILSYKYLLKLNIIGTIRTSNNYLSRSYHNLRIHNKIYMNLLPQIPKHLNKFKYIKNSGLMSIIFMIDYFKPKKVHMFGFNFYQTKMIKDYSPQDPRFHELLTLKKAGNLLIDNFIVICKLYKNIIFYRYDDNQIKKISNLKQINI